MTGRNAAVASALREAGARWVDWVLRTATGELLFAADGWIYRAPQGAGLDDLARCARPLIDLTAMRFELISAPPEAFEWPMRQSTPATGGTVRKGRRRKRR